MDRVATQMSFYDKLSQKSSPYYISLGFYIITFNKCVLYFQSKTGYDESKDDNALSCTCTKSLLRRTVEKKDRVPGMKLRSPDSNQQGAYWLGGSKQNWKLALLKSDLGLFIYCSIAQNI